MLLYWWPDDGWQRGGTVARLCPRGAFSHVVAYTRQTWALRGTADSLLDAAAASYGTRWVLWSPAQAAGVVRALRSRGSLPGPALNFTFSLVGGPGPGLVTQADRAQSDRPWPWTGPAQPAGASEEATNE